MKERAPLSMLLFESAAHDASRRSLLERCGYSVEVVTDIDAALRILAARPADMVVADAEFAPPEEAAQTLRFLLNEHPLPLLLFLPIADIEIHPDIDELARLGFAPKGCGEALLRVAVENALELFDARGRGSGECLACDLRESERRFRSMVANIPGVVYRCRMDREWTMLYMSDLVETLTGCPASEFIGSSIRSYASIIHPDDTSFVERCVADAAASGRPWETEYRIRRNDGSERWVYEQGVPVFGEAGEVLFLDGFILDITDRKRVEDQLNSERMRLSNVIEGANAGTWECNLQTGEMILNAKWAETLGYTLEELSPITMDIWLSVLHPDDLGQVGDILAQHVRGELDSYDHEVRMRHKDGRWLWMHCKGRIISRTSDGEPLWMYGTHIDVSDRKQTERELLEANRRLVAMQEILEREATHDALTGVLNRRAILEHLSAELARCRRDGTRLSVAMCDIDHFKRINDTYGHQTGDDVLCGLVRLLRGNLREYDRIGRIGGEEFLLILPVAAAQNENFHERLVKKIAESGIETRSGVVHVTMSLGAVTVSGDTDMDEILALSDKAMYKAKAKGRNRAICVGEIQ